MAKGKKKKKERRKIAAATGATAVLGTIAGDVFSRVLTRVLSDQVEGYLNKRGKKKVHRALKGLTTRRETSRKKSSDS